MINGEYVKKELKALPYKDPYFKTFQYRLEIIKVAWLQCKITFFKLFV